MNDAASEDASCPHERRAGRLSDHKPVGGYPHDFRPVYSAPPKVMREAAEEYDVPLEWALVSPITEGRGESRGAG